MPHPLANDLDHVLEHARPAWTQLRGCRLFITGGTRFFGAWLLESLLWANERLGLGAKALVLTRDPEDFRRRAPRLTGQPAVELLAGDVRSFTFPRGDFSHVVHGASSLNRDDPFATLETVVEGTRRTLEFARQAGVKACLYVSSGAVYGLQPAASTHIDEECVGAPDPVDPRSTYGQGKRAAEHLCALYHQRFALPVKIARAFAFAGPYLPLDRHNALGNFIRDGLAGGPIRVTGDGTPCRSYLYGADLAVWLWTILTSGAACRPYNVGSEAGLTIAELAAHAAEAFGTTVSIAKPAVPGGRVDRYVPSTKRASRELGLRERVDVREAIRRTAAWVKADAGSAAPDKAAR